ncbi:hypothetical protein NP493_2031g00028 [Ridgeia piscesae]|uniref:Uncharacterized protein n=1 Tax=Ridgeia piscesae TaxID=27915 RepID=A0AAD9N401_RIDPI|nr:hypothetical protein NP493_2031g00028 [Ridgeia piscesae]
MMPLFCRNTVRYFSSLLGLNLFHSVLGKGHTPFRKVFTFSRILEIIDLSNNVIRHIHPIYFSYCI